MGSIFGVKIPSARDITNSIFPGAGNLIPSAPDVPDSEAPAREEEARKAALRRKIDVLYGIKPTGVAATDPDFKLATDAGTELEGEQTKLGDATRSYYTDALAKQYGKAERNARFAFARSGLLGGSGSVDAMTELKSERDLGATRVDEAVRRAITSLTSQRENERLNAIGLVNSGAGDSAVTAAQRGLQNSFETANTAQKADLFGDLFGSAANAVSASNLAAQQASAAARYKNQLSTFFPTTGSSTGRITPSA